MECEPLSPVVDPFKALEAAEEDVVWENRRFQVRGAPERSVIMTDVAFAAYTNPPPGMEPGLEAIYYYGAPT